MGVGPRLRIAHVVLKLRVQLGTLSLSLLPLLVYTQLTPELSVHIVDYRCNFDYTSYLKPPVVLECSHAWRDRLELGFYPVRRLLPSGHSRVLLPCQLFLPFPSLPTL